MSAAETLGMGVKCCDTLSKMGVSYRSVAVHSGWLVIKVDLADLNHAAALLFGADTPSRVGAGIGYQSVDACIGRVAVYLMADMEVAS